MIYKTIFSTRFALFVTLFLNLNYPFAQNCDSLTLDLIIDPGEYTIATLTESDNIRNGPGYNGATIYYPTNATPPFTGMVIVPGYVSPQSSIQSWGPFLASHGIVTMTIGTNSIYEFPEARGDALLDALITLKNENIRTGSPLIGKIDTNSLSVGGWSMGGGGAQLAAAKDTTLKAVMAICPWLDNGQLAPANLVHPVPVLFFSGENDGIAPPAIHANVHYDYTPQSTNKLLFEIASGGHSVANGPSGGEDYVGKIAVSWLRYFLGSDTCYCPLVLDTPPTASKYLLNIECSMVVSNKQVINKGMNSYQLYPNPASGSIQLEVKNLIPHSNYQIFSMTGALVDGAEVLNQLTSIAIQDLAPGVYLFNLRSSKTSTMTRFVVH